MTLDFLFDMISLTKTLPDGSKKTYTSPSSVWIRAIINSLSVEQQEEVLGRVERYVADQGLTELRIRTDPPPAENVTEANDGRATEETGRG